MEPLKIWAAQTTWVLSGGWDVMLTRTPIACVGSMRAVRDGWVPDDLLREWMPGLSWYPHRGLALDAMLAAVRRPGRAGHYVITCGYRRPRADDA